MSEVEVEFGTFEPEEKVNPYTDTISKLIEGGENAAVTIKADAKDEKKIRLQVSKAANAQDKTARMRIRDDSKVKYDTNENGEQVVKGGTVALTFTLSKRHAARRGQVAAE